MKQIILFFFVFHLTFNGLNAQPLLKFESHALQDGYVHVNQKISHVYEGTSGEHCFWDFSQLVCGEISRTKIHKAIEDEAYNSMDNSNIVTDGGGTRYFYHLDENKLEYWGYISDNVVITFDKPIVRMNYPFHFKEKIDGEFSGSGLHNNTIITSISGTYSIEMDSKGTILLPNGGSINNAFRIKSVEHFIETSCKTSEWFITKYMWYSPDYRYPVFSVIYTDIRDGENSSFTHNAYFNEEAISIKNQENTDFISQLKLEIFPNPTNDKISINYFVAGKQPVNIEIFSLSGTKIATLVKNEEQQDWYKFEFSAKNLGILPGVYAIKFSLKEKSLTRRIVVQD